jgi:hypothetical protein
MNYAGRPVRPSLRSLASFNLLSALERDGICSAAASPEVEGSDLQAVEELSGGASAEASAVGVGEDLLERVLEGSWVGDARQRADGSCLGAASAMVVTEGVAGDGGTAAGLSIGAARGAAAGGVGVSQHGTGEVALGGVDPPGGGGGIDPVDPVF